MTIATILAEHLVGRYICFNDYSKTESSTDHFPIDNEVKLLVTKIDTSNKQIKLTLERDGQENDFYLESIAHLFIKVKHWNEI